MSPETSSKPIKSVSPKRFLIIFILFIAIFTAYLDRVNTSIFAADDKFLLDMGIFNSPLHIGLLMSVFLVAYGISSFLLGSVGDIWGLRKAMLTAVLLWCVSLFIGGLATTFSVILISRVLLGIGEGWYYPMQNGVVKNWFPENERGRANAIWVIGQSVAPAVAMPFFTYIVGAHGWREAYHISFALTLLPLCLIWFFLKDTHPQYTGNDKNYNKKETINNNVPELPLAHRLSSFIFNYQYWILVYWYMTMTAIYWGLVSWLPVYLKSERGFSWHEMGWIASLPFILTIFTKALNGWLNDKYKRSAPLLFLALFLGAIFIYLAVTVTDKYNSAILLSFAFGTTSMATSVAWTLLQKIVPQYSISTSSGVMNGIASFVSSIMPVAIGYIISITSSYASGMYLLVCSGFVASLVVLPLILKKY
ncbi:membrane protein [Salmonella enterica subsp. diarizonae]|nr:membrane protein [Salmonella enterica subsp. diarizonae]